jgi:Tfp pilus assembly protein PilN
MLRTNLSTRPFYNERLVHLVLGVLAVVVVAVSAVNLWQAVALTRRQATLAAQTSAADGKAASLRADAGKIRAGINTRDLQATAVAAREANAIIERRAFSWTDLFNRLEETLPDAVRVSAVRPKIDEDGQITLSLVVVARSVKAVDTFIENLEKHEAFSGLLATEEFLDEEGLLQATIEGRYTPPRAAGKGGRP